jgi:hypothetical protein
MPGGCERRTRAGPVSRGDDGLRAPLVRWSVANQVSAAAIIDGPIFMAVAVVLVRTIGLGVRASRLPRPVLTSQHG